MKISKYSLAILAVAGLLAACPSGRAQTNMPPGTGAGAGGAGARRGPTVDAQLARLTEQLKLTDEQKPKVKVVLEETNKEMQGLRDLPQDERRTKMQSIREENNKKLKAILTPEQFKHYEEFMKQQRGQRTGGGGGGGGAGGGGGGQNHDANGSKPGGNAP